MIRSRLVKRESLMDAKAVLNLFSDWLDSATPIQLAQAGRWIQEQAKMRCYPGAVQDLQRVNEMIRQQMFDNGENR